VESFQERVLDRAGDRFLQALVTRLECFTRPSSCPALAGVRIHELNVNPCDMAILRSTGLCFAINLRVVANRCQTKQFSFHECLAYFGLDDVPRLELIVLRLVRFRLVNRLDELGGDE
jgi:hypothetical protein